MYFTYLRVVRRENQCLWEEGKKDQGKKRGRGIGQLIRLMT